MRKFVLFWLLLLLPAGIAAQQKKPVTVDAAADSRIWQATPIWSPAGTNFVWVEEGNVRLYDVVAKTSRQLVSLLRLEAAATPPNPPTAYPWENRYLSEQTVQWFPSGTELLIRAKGDLFQFQIRTEQWIQLTATAEDERDPKVSPNGRHVSFRREHDLYVLDISSRQVTRLTHDGSEALRNAELDWVYPEELGLGTAHWWSPDSTRIAYLQFDVSREPLYPHVELLTHRGSFEPQRYPKAGDPNADVRLGVISTDGQGRTQWMDLGQTRDNLFARFHWLPDSSGIAVHRLNRIQNRLDLLIADAATGDSRQVLRETDPHWLNLNNSFRFLRGGKEFLWQSERSGFAHLYRYSIEGKQLAQLTRGDWAVTEVTNVDETAGQVYYVSTESSPLERHLYRVSLNGGVRTPLTSKPGMHAISMGPRAEYYLDTFSSLTSPPGWTLHKNDGTELAVVREPDTSILDEYEILPAEIVQVKSADSALLYARLIRPAGFEPQTKYPAIVLVYGGPHVQSIRNTWAGLGLEQVLAHNGFVVWQLDNRGTSGRGHHWESAVFRNFGQTELQDQKDGLRHLLSLGFVDPARVGIHGWSYGGYMTLYSLANAPELFQAGVAGAPVTDWRNYDTIYTERYMGLPSENSGGYRRSSPVHQAAAIQAELLIIHNLQDDNVLVQNTLQMADELQRAGRQFGLTLYSAKGHGVTSEYRKHFLKAVLNFFERTLKN